MKRAMVPATVTSVAVTLFLITPELVTQLVMVLATFLVSLLVLAVIHRSQLVAGLKPVQQHFVIWLVSTGTGVSVCLLPRVLSVLNS